MTSRILRRAAALALGLTTATATAAVAHPSFNPNQVPAGETVETTLVVPHGCDPDGGMPGDDGGTATTLFELQLTGAFAMFEARDTAGWDISRDGDVVTWRDAGGSTTDPIELPVAFSLTGEAGEELYLSAYQACEAGGEFRWIGTPDREADFPAVKLTLTTGAVGTEEVTDGEHSGHGGAGSERASETGTEHGTQMGRGDATASQMSPETSSETAMDEAAAGGANLPLIVVIVVLVVAGAALALRRRGVA